MVLGPGSWYTSVLVHFLVNQVARRARSGVGPRPSLRSILRTRTRRPRARIAWTTCARCGRIEPAIPPRYRLADASHGADPVLGGRGGGVGLAARVCTT